MKFPEQYRKLVLPQCPQYQTKPGDPYGMFQIPHRDAYHRTINVIAADGVLPVAEGWEHVSVSILNLAGHGVTPTWEEMCLVKSLFWEANQCVVQYHPPEKDYVNDNPGVLHLWHCTKLTFPMPPQICV